jgi:hypothetical protein
MFKNLASLRKTKSLACSSEQLGAAEPLQSADTNCLQFLVDEVVRLGGANNEQSE